MLTFVQNASEIYHFGDLGTSQTFPILGGGGNFQSEALENCRMTNQEVTAITRQHVQ
jgi:hypothetical protein